MPEENGTEGAEGAVESAAPESAESPTWLGPIEERMNELRDQNYEMAQYLASLGGQPEETEEEEELIPEDQWYDDEGDLTPEAAQQIIDQRVQEALGQHFAQRDFQDGVATRDELYDDLLERVPDLIETGPELVSELVAELRQAGQEHVIDSPLFVDLIELRHKAGQWDAHSETERAQQPVVLESAGGTSGSQRSRQPEEDWSERIVKAAERLRPKI